MMVDILESNVEGLFRIRNTPDDDEEWYVFELESGTMIWFREKNGVMETRVEQ